MTNWDRMHAEMDRKDVDVEKVKDLVVKGSETPWTIPWPRGTSRTIGMN